MVRRFGNYQQSGDTRQIGSGFFGTVNLWYNANDKPKRTVYAGKEVENQNWKHGELTSLMRCKHDNIVRYIDFAQDPKTRAVLLVTELLNATLIGGLRPKAETLFMPQQCGCGVRVLRSRFDPPLNQDEVLKVLSDCFRGLVYLHEKDIMHRDISSSNILLQVSVDTLGRRIVGKIGDFGLAKVCNEVNPSTVLTNKFYAAPEANGREYDGFATDTYSLGVVIIESLMTISGNWNAIAEQYRYSHFITVQRTCQDILRPLLPEAMWKLLSLMVDEDPEQRPLFVESDYDRWVRCCSDMPNIWVASSTVDPPENNASTEQDDFYVSNDQDGTEMEICDVGADVDCLPHKEESWKDLLRDTGVSEEQFLQVKTVLANLDDAAIIRVCQANAAAVR